LEGLSNAQAPESVLKKDKKKKDKEKKKKRDKSENKGEKKLKVKNLYEGEGASRGGSAIEMNEEDEEDIDNVIK